MPIDKHLIDELRVLACFNLDSTQSGIKVHHDAGEELVCAADRLYHKGLISQTDGGYLTPLGHDAAEHLQGLLTILTTKPMSEALP